MEHLPEHLHSGDLLVVNDAATLPASLHGRDEENNPLEIRLTSQLDKQIWQAVAFGDGNWHTPTEDRPSPPRFRKGEEITIAPNFSAVALGENSLSGRLLDLGFNLSEEELWRSLYRYGKPVQYRSPARSSNSGRCRTSTAAAPRAVEMPGAGHALSWQLLLKLIRKGVQLVPLTHGAGLSSTGDANITSASPGFTDPRGQDH